MNLGSDPVQNNPSKFNFDDNEGNPEVNIFDVQSLFSLLNEE